MAIVKRPVHEVLPEFIGKAASDFLPQVVDFIRAIIIPAGHSAILVALEERRADMGEDLCDLATTSVRCQLLPSSKPKSGDANLLAQ